MPNYIPGEGPFNPKLMIIGEAPGKLENEYKRFSNHLPLSKMDQERINRPPNLKTFLYTSKDL